MRKPRTKGGAELMRYVSFVILHTHLSLFSVPDICRTLNESLAIQQSLKLLFSLYQVIDHISQGKTPIEVNIVIPRARADEYTTLKNMSSTSRVSFKFSA